MAPNVWGIVQRKLLTRELSHCTSCQGLGRKGDNVLCGNSDYLDLVRRPSFGAVVANFFDGSPRQHQPLHAGFAVVNGLNMGAQVVHPVKATAAFITKKRFFTWNQTDKIWQARIFSEEVAYRFPALL